MIAISNAYCLPSIYVGSKELTWTKVFDNEMLVVIYVYSVEGNRKKKL